MANPITNLTQDVSLHEYNVFCRPAKRSNGIDLLVGQLLLRISITGGGSHDFDIGGHSRIAVKVFGMQVGGQNFTWQIVEQGGEGKSKLYPAVDTQETVNGQNLNMNVYRDPQDVAGVEGGD